MSVSDGRAPPVSRVRGTRTDYVGWYIFVPTRPVITCTPTCNAFKSVRFRGIKANRPSIYKPGILELFQRVSMLIGWNGLLLVDTSATARSRPTHSFSYLIHASVIFFRIAIKARKKIVMTPNCSQCAISRLKM